MLDSALDTDEEGLEGTGLNFSGSKPSLTGWPNGFNNSSSSN